MAKQKDEPTKVGRKPRAGGAASNVSVRLSGSERATYQAAADAKSMSISEWIRDCCARILGRKRS